MADPGLELIHLREEVLVAVREEIVSLGSELREDLQRELQSSFKACFAEVRGDVSKNAQIHTLRNLAKPIEDPPTMDLPGQPDLMTVDSIRTHGGDGLPSSQAEAPLQPHQRGVTFKTSPDSKSAKALRHADTTSTSSSTKRFRPLHCAKPRLQKAMGFVPDLEEEMVNESGITRKAENLVRHVWFEYISMILILCNMVQVGLTTNYKATTLTTDQVPSGYRALEVILFLLFTTEISIRLIAYHRHFFSVFGWGWNAFDLALVSIQLLEETMVLLDDSLQLSSVLVLRVARVLRTIRIFRVMRMTKFSKDLRLLASCIMYCMGTFFWATSFLVLLIFIMSIYFTDVIISARIKFNQADEDDHGLTELYGSVPRSCLSLFQALTGGMDWSDLVSPFQQISEFLPLLYICYIAFAFLAVLNLVTGVFCQNAMERAETVNAMQRLYEARQLFKSLDVDLSGQISRDELIDQLDSEDMADFLKSINCDSSEVEVLFHILDKEGNGSIESDEFVNGLLRLQGTAKSIDLMKMNYDVRAFMHEVRSQRMLE